MVPDNSLQESRIISINEVLKPLPKKILEVPKLLTTISEMAKMLVLNEPKKDLLMKTLKLISRVISCERLAVLFVSENHEEITIGASLKPGGKDLGAFNLSRTIIGQVITNKNAVLLGNPEDDSRFASQESIITSNLKSAMAVPLFDEGEVLGILYADTVNPECLYDEEHIRILAIFGNIIASRLTNLSLLTEREEKRVIESELKRASEIQENLLVTQSPMIDGLEIQAFQEQSRSVGGDLYDMKILPDKRLLFLVADVSGKGTGAALLMSNILASFRILYESKDFNLTEIVKMVSLQVFRYTEPGIFATLFIGLVNSNDGTIHYINAGHNPPILVRNDGNIEYLQPTGVMIGAFDYVEWTVETVTLLENDKLLIFSDGVTEAQGDTCFYGDDRLLKVVDKKAGNSATDLINNIMDDVKQFVGNKPQADDITIMVLKRT
jgi:serine phosphatase RsbU (regulator of sigma subunit)